MPTLLRPARLAAPLVGATLAAAALTGCSGGGDDDRTEPPRLEIEGWVIDSFPLPPDAEVEPFEQPAPDAETVRIVFVPGTQGLEEFYAETLPEEGYDVAQVGAVGLNFTGNGVTGDVLRGDPVVVQMTTELAE